MSEGVEIGVARQFALSLPEVTEEPHFEWGSWRVKRKIFTTIPSGGRLLHIFLDALDAQVLASNLPDAFEELWWGKKLAGVRVRLAKADEELVLSLLEKAWRRRAPKRLVAQFDEELSLVRAAEKEG